MGAHAQPLCALPSSLRLCVKPFSSNPTSTRNVTGSPSPSVANIDKRYWLTRAPRASHPRTVLNRKPATLSGSARLFAVNIDKRY